MTIRSMNQSQEQKVRPAPVGEVAEQKPEAPAAGPGLAERAAPSRRVGPVDSLPPFKVLLHNDPVNTIDHVVESIVELTPLDHAKAVEVTLEADNSGVALLLVTHKERAELYLDQFQSKKLTVTIESAN